MKQLCDGQTRFRVLKSTESKSAYDASCSVGLSVLGPSSESSKLASNIQNICTDTNSGGPGKVVGSMMVLNSSTSLSPVMPTAMKPKRHRRSSKHQMAACCNCKRRRKKCDGKYPICSGCKRLGLECTIIYAPTGREIKRNYIDLLEGKLTKLENLLREKSRSDASSICKDDLTTEHSDGATMKGDENNLMGMSIPSVKMNSLSFSKTELTSPMSITGSSSSVEASKNNNDFLEQVGMITVGSEEDPRYVGETSAYSIARAISKSIYFFDDIGFYQSENKLPKDIHIQNPTSKTPFLMPSATAANTYLKAYKNTIQCQYPYLDWDEVLKWFDNVIKNGDKSKSKTAKFFIYMIFAIGSQLLNPLSGHTKMMRMYHDKAFENLDHMIHHNTIHTIQAYLMLTQFAQGMPAGASVWEATGMAIRSAVALGLHRGQTTDIISRQELSSEEITKREELRARVFWSAYGIERVNGLILGRPFSISDVDIDLPMPEETPETQIGCQVIKLRRIQSSISTFIYKPERLIGTKEELECTRVQIVLELNDWVKNFSYEKRARSAFQSNNWAIISYHNSMTVLLRPIIIKISKTGVQSSSNDLEWFRTFARSTAAICLNYKKLYEKGLFRFMWMSVHCCFVAGISFIYSIWLDRKLHVLKWEKCNIINRTIGACSDILHVAADHWKSAEVFEETFQRLVNVVKNSFGDNGMTPPSEKDDNTNENFNFGYGLNTMVSDLKEPQNSVMIKHETPVYSLDTMKVDEGTEGTGPDFDSANFNIDSTAFKCDDIPTVSQNNFSDVPLDGLLKYFEISGGSFIQNVFNELKQESLNK